MPPEQNWAGADPAPITDPLELSMSALSLNSHLESPQPALWLPNGLFGGYRLLERIGAGGMGEVWSAEQLHPIRRRVALKLIKAGMDTREVLQRFQAERQALALMDHPGIAKVFDAGATPSGRSYFAMEFIAGIPITQYCDLHKMSVPERLRLFIHVCDAVQHAHQKAIIHRDLKPSNILVGEIAGQPQPHIIDFGLAKAISAIPAGQTQFTQTGVAVGTPAYMSPEQALSTGLDVDTRADVYSLGVVLYELLVGARPLELHNLPFDKVVLRLREKDSPIPSAKLRSQRSESRMIAENRASDLPTLLRDIRGDLDAIALKALERDRRRRYASASDLAAEIERYLHHQPVLAVPPSVAYRARKFTRRHRPALAIVTAFLLVIVVAVAVSLRQRARAISEAEAAQAVNDFLRNDLLTQATTYGQWQTVGKGDPDLKVRTALDRAAARITGKFSRQPDVEVAIRKTIAQSYMQLGLGSEAQRQFERVLALQRRTLNEDDPDVLKTRGALASVTGSQGNYAAAVALYRQLLPVQRSVLGSKNEFTLDSMYHLAETYREQGKYPEAGSLFSELLEIARSSFGPENEFSLLCMDRLAEIHYRQGNYVQAQTLGEQVLAIRRRVSGQENPQTTISMSDLGNVYGAQGKFAMAKAIYAETFEIRRRILGPESPYVMAAMNNLARAYSDLGEYSQAEALDTQAFDLRRRVLGPQTVETLMSMDNLACDYANLKKYAQAKTLFDQTLGIEVRLMGLESRFTLGTLSDLAFMYQRQGKYTLARVYAAKVLPVWRQSLGPQSPVTMAAAEDLALAFVSERNFSASEPLAREAMAFYQKSKPDDWQLFRAESLLGASLAGQKKYAEAEPHLLQSSTQMETLKDQIAIPDRYNIDCAKNWLNLLYRHSHVRKIPVKQSHP